MKWYKFELNEFTMKYSDLVLRWRNSSRIRSSMLTNEIISVDRHETWLKKVLSDDTKIIKILFYESKPIGLVNFTNIDLVNETCYWGIYIGEESAPKGSGTVLGYLALNMIFEEIKIRKVYAEVIEENQISLNFHKKLGFIEEGRFVNHLKRGTKYLDVISMALFNECWNQRRQQMLTRMEEVFDESSFY